MPVNRKLRKFIDTKYLSDSAVTTAKIEALGVASGDIANDAVTNTQTGPIQKKYLKAVYDFAVLGGAASAINLNDAAGAPLLIPDNAVITGVSIEGITDNTSGGAATIALGYTGQAVAFLAATAFNHATWDVNAVTSATPTVAVGKTTAPVFVIATIADAALTAGKWQLWIEYYEGA
tara:strand:+ start:3069 stop:3599 length:531 start_codon:yes stop_codon:yes gene_type:complete